MDDNKLSIQDYQKLTIRLSELLNLKTDHIKNKCGDWGKIISSKRFILSTDMGFYGINAVGLMWGEELNNLKLDYSPFPFPPSLHKIILVGNANYGYFDTSVVDYEYYSNYYSRGSILDISNISIKVKQITAIPKELELEALDNFDFHRELFELYKREISPQLLDKLIHGPENNLILDDSVREEILLLNKKSIKNVERKIK